MRETARGQRNETFRRLDREAETMGVKLDVLGPNIREVEQADGARRYRMTPGGKGVIRITAYSPEPGGWIADAFCVVGPERARAILVVCRPDPA